MQLKEQRTAEWLLLRAEKMLYLAETRRFCTISSYPLNIGKTLFKSYAASTGKELPEFRQV